MILVILVGGDARDLGVRSGQVVRGAGLAGLVSPGPGGEGGVVLGAQQEAGAGPRAELPGVEDRSHLRPGLRAVIVIAAGLGEAHAAVPGGGNALASLSIAITFKICKNKSNSNDVSLLHVSPTFMANTRTLLFFLFHRTPKWSY